MSLWDVFLSALKGTPGKSIGVNIPLAGTGYKNMRDLIALIDAVCDAYDRADFKPNPDGSTHCNQAVQAIAEAMGCFDFKDLTADQMVDLMETSKRWQPVDFARAQDITNRGSLVVAGLKSNDLKQGHGHVVVVRPGHPCQSGKWGATPRCVNIGGHDFLARAQVGPLTMMPVGLNDAFIPMPKIWAWEQSL
jgi:hypothetical protein